DIYRKVIEINLIGTFNVCRLAATGPVDRSRRRGKITYRFDSIGEPLSSGSSWVTTRCVSIVAS
ncbi:MAG: hypothetical protein WA860_06945, partial [Acidimicrobiales bacterium]